MSSRGLATSARVVVEGKRKSRPRSPSIEPISVKKNGCFSQAVESEDLLLHYYKESITKSLTCIGLNEIQIPKVLAQIDNLLSDTQSNSLRRAKILTNRETDIIKESIQLSNSLLTCQSEIIAARKVQSIVRGWIVRKKMNTLGTEDREKIKMRFTNYCEILRTEKTFMESLQTLQSTFIIPINDNAGKLNLGDAAVNYLSGNISAMLELHTRLYNQLEGIRDQLAYPIVLHLGELVNDVSAELRAEHMSFANNYVACIETLRYLQSVNHKFQSFIAEREGRAGSLEALFDKPLRYLVAFSKRLKSLHSITFPAIEGEMGQLSRAISIIENIDVASWKILDEQQNVEANAYIKKTLIVELKIEGLQEPLLGTPNRKMLKEGCLRVSKKKNQAYQLFLFTDVIVFAEKIVNSQKFKFIRKVYAPELTVEENGTKIILTISQGPTKPPIIETLSIKNSRERTEWAQQLKIFVEMFKTNCVYGTSLETIVKREEIPEKIPFVMVLCTKYLRAYAQTAEGIFRVPGEQVKVETFQRLFDYGATEVDFRGCSVHDVATLLKLYLRMLPEPLIPFSAYPELVKVQKNFEENLIDDSNYLNSTAAVIKEMAPVNRRALKYLLSFLQDFSQYAKHTKMTTNNLALVFVPNVVRPERDTVETVMQSQLVTRIFEYCITNYQILWDTFGKLDSSISSEEEDGSNEKADKPFIKAASRYTVTEFDIKEPEEKQPPAEKPVKLKKGSPLNFQSLRNSVKSKSLK